MPNGDDNWLAPHRHCFEAEPVLELGCGDGRDTRALLTFGTTVVATDVSAEALALHAATLPGVPRVQLDIGAGLPFAAQTFGCVLASLSLHYFYWSKTVAVFADVRRCLRPGGWLVLRVNSRRDVYYGARGYPMIEPNFYRVRGRDKRFFDEADIRTLGATGWSIDYLEAQTIDRYDRPKHVLTARLQQAQTSDDLRQRS